MYTCDSIEALQWDFQDPATPVMLGIIDLHHDLRFFLVSIFTFVSWMLFRTLLHFSSNTNLIFPLIHGTKIEIIWTLIPCIILVLISVPSFSLLYSLDEVIEPALTVKIIGLQWYWSYEFSDYITKKNQFISYDSYLIAEEDLTLGQFNRLEVDQRLILPALTHIRLLITANDVLHSFAVPSLGIKCDAIPGRLNQTSLFLLREGVFYGQCSELCGINHAFMPIVIEAVNLTSYVTWIYVRLTA
nr:Cox2 [Porphyridium aerugineum]